MDGGVADDPLPFGRLGTPGLELRFDQGDHLPTGPQPVLDHRQQQFQGNKGGVHRHQMDLLRQGLEKAGVGLLQDDHARIVPQLPMQQAFTHVDGVHFFGTVLEKTIRETPGRGAHIGTGFSGGLDPEGNQGSLQLLTAARDKAWSGLQIHPRLQGYLGRRLQDPLTLHAHLTGHDQALRLRPAFGQTALHQQKVDPHLFHEFIVTPGRDFKYN